MATVDTTRTSSLGVTRGGGASGDKIFSGLTVVAAATVLAILAGIAFSTTQNAWPALSEMGPAFLYRNDWRPNSDQFGALGIIYGTAVISMIALVLAVPVSFGIAFFTTEIAPKRVAKMITTVMDLLAAIPSVVFGLFGFLFLAPKMKSGLYDHLHSTLGGLPVVGNLFGEASSGRGFMTAGVILALMIVPIITSVAREVLATVPINDRNGALALGATRWEMIKGVVLPHSLGGLVGAVMLGLGRAMGETIAVALLIGANVQIVANLFAPGESMPSIIARNLNEANASHRSALIGLGVTLFALTIFVNVGARGIVASIDRRIKGTA